MTKGRVLVVDDETDIKNLISEAFTMSGYDALGASGGDQANGILQNNEIDIVVSDIRMSNGDGVDLLKKIRSISMTNPKVILITGYTEYSRPELFESGADLIIAKPFDIDFLINNCDLLLLEPPQRWAAASSISGLTEKLSARFESFDSSVEKQLFAGGNVGFSIEVKYVQNIRLGENFLFSIEFGADGINFSGIGRLIWKDETAGIIVEYLNDECLDWYLGKISKTELAIPRIAQ